MSEALKEAIGRIRADDVCRVIISKPLPEETRYRKIIVEKKDGFYQLSCFTQKQVFHENVTAEELSQRLYERIWGCFGQVEAWGETGLHRLLLSRKGSVSYRKKTLTEEARRLRADADKATSTAHNRRKNYLIAEGREVAPLVDMGIFTREGRVVAAKYDKFRQINRFLELLDDEISRRNPERLGVIDFGCGKSYLTFIVYYYLTSVKGIPVQMVGLDLKEEVIEKCNRAAERYGYTELHFELGDINGYEASFPVDLVITLHACDTATDFALQNAIKWKAEMIFSVPCCQHELNSQMKPQRLSLLRRYGIVQERFCALATDAIRANLLEYCGYRTQLLEFIDMENTPKNLLIRAVRRPITPKGVREKALSEAEELMEEFGFMPALYQLLGLSREASQES